MNLNRTNWEDLLQGRRPYLGKIAERPVIFPGSFNPVHQGHQQMARITAEILCRPVCPEISLINVDKPRLEYTLAAKRIADASQLGQVIVTRAARFVEKASLFREATFVIGADTALRLDQARYYNDDEFLRAEALQQIAEHGIRFLVFGRKIAHQFIDANELNLSPSLRKLCQFVPATQFRNDISSSQLRSIKSQD